MTPDQQTAATDRPTPLDVAREHYAREMEATDLPKTAARVRAGEYDDMVRVASRASAIELDRSWKNRSTVSVQQTAATDNALEPVAWMYHKPGGTPYTSHVPPEEVKWQFGVSPLYGPEAAERIKSLQAEADELRVQLAQTIMQQDEEWQEAKADRQRMREALDGLLNMWSSRTVAAAQAALANRGEAGA